MVISHFIYFFDTAIKKIKLSHYRSKMGNLYYVRVFAHNSAGFGKSAEAVPVKPMQSPDPPHLPRLFYLSNADYYKMGTSLVVEWDKPMIDKVNDRPDMVGNGGSAIKSYLIEYSKVVWHYFTSTAWKIEVDNDF